MGADVDVDVVIVGAGMAGLYGLHRLRGEGFSVVVVETADDVGGTWYWNRYPGARCDVPSVDYSYSFDPELEADWQWSEKYATQPEILSYLQHVADRYELRPDIRFSTRVVEAVWDDESRRWSIRTDDGATLTCRYYIMATGCLSVPKVADLAGLESFAGPVYYTSSWPHEGVDFTGRRVGVIGTGSSGIQSIPIIADQAASLTVFQRTPNFMIPARNGPIPESGRAAQADYRTYRAEARMSAAGVPTVPAEHGAFEVSDEERTATYEAVWESGTIIDVIGTYRDLLADKSANDTLAAFLHSKIRDAVDDPELAEKMLPEFPVGTKRLCVDSGYYETFNRPEVSLVDLREDPIVEVTAAGVRVESGEHEFDAIVMATGFDAMTGALVSVDISGRDGTTLKQKWEDGPRTYLGLMTAGFPNLFMVTGPQSPSVLSNMAVSIEQHIEWISDTLVRMRDAGEDSIEPTPLAEEGWVQYCADFGDATLFPLADSWYMGANVPGKPRVFTPYVGGVGRYRQTCDDVVEHDMIGFRRTAGAEVRVNDGLVRRLKPDVELVLEFMAELGLPPLDSLPVPEARAFLVASREQSPPGPEVGSVVDGVLPGHAGDVEYRLYRPDTGAADGVVVYFHGGGWVIGDHTSDDPFCRYLCAHTGAAVVSVNYSHAPERPFPAAPLDGLAAVRWVADSADELGVDTDRLLVAGWSAGANVAAVVSHLVRDEGGPPIAGQILINPVTDHDMSRPSYIDNAEGYFLTRSLMEWFWDHYAAPADRNDPRVSVLRADDLSGLPPALVVTAEFDPLRDEGAAYADALDKAGVEVEHLSCPGQIHTSMTSIGVIGSAESARAHVVAVARRFLGARSMSV